MAAALMSTMVRWNVFPSVPGFMDASIVITMKVVNRWRASPIPPNKRASCLLLTSFLFFMSGTYNGKGTSFEGQHAALNRRHERHLHV